MNPTDYHNAVDQVFDRLDAARHRPRSSIDLNIDRWQGVGVISGLALAVVPTAAAMVALDFPSHRAALVGMGTFFTSMCAGMYLCNLFNYEHTATPAINACLSLVGRALPLTPDQASELTSWSQQHPRLVETLGRWAAANPDHHLNQADYFSAQAATRKANAAADKQKKIDAVNEQIRASGVLSATNRQRLSGVASFHPRPAAAPPAKRGM